MQKTNLWSPGHEGGRYKLGGWDWHTDVTRKTPQTEGPGGLPSMGLRQCGHGWVCTHEYTHTCKRDNQYEPALCSSTSHSARPCGLSPARLLCPWDSPGKNAGVGGHALLRGSSRPRDWTRVSCTAGRFFPAEPPKGGEVARHVWLSVTPQTVACQAPPSVGFSRQEYWSGLPFPSPGESQPRDQTQVSCTAGRRFAVWAAREARSEMSLSPVRLFATPRTVRSREFSRTEYWSGQLFPFSRGSSQPRHRTGVSCIAGRTEPPGEPQMRACFYSVLSNGLYGKRILKSGYM